MLFQWVTEVELGDVQDRDGDGCEGGGRTQVQIRKSERPPVVLSKLSTQQYKTTTAILCCARNFRNLRMNEKFKFCVFLIFTKFAATWEKLIGKNSFDI